MNAEARYEVFAYFADGSRGSCCAHGPIHGMRRILRSFPEFRRVKLVRLVVLPGRVSYFGTDR